MVVDHCIVWERFGERGCTFPKDGPGCSGSIWIAWGHFCLTWILWIGREFKIVGLSRFPCHICSFGDGMGKSGKRGW